MGRWHTSSPATNASTSSRTTASTPLPDVSADAGTLLVAAELTPKPSLPASTTLCTSRHLGPVPRSHSASSSPTHGSPTASEGYESDHRYRYGWMIDRYIAPAIGDYSLRSIRTDHLNDLYVTLTAGGDMTDDRSPPRPCTKFTSSSEARSLRRPRKGSPASTSPYRHAGRAHTHAPP